jgi:cytoskeletal protein CcmA (bactofilin family)
MRKATPKRTVRCYLCGHRFEVSSRAMSTTCPRCHKAIKIEDVIVKSYIPVVDLQTCGRIRITKRGRVAAQRIQCGDGIECEGTMEGSVESDGDVTLGPKAMWKGKTLQSRALHIAPGAKLVGVVTVPWSRIEPKMPNKAATKATVATAPTARKKTTKKVASATKKTTTAKKTTAKKTTAKKTTAKKTTAKKTTAKKTTATRKTATAKKTAKTARKVAATRKTASRKTTSRKKKAG